MSDYIKQLEQQNDELMKSLAKAQETIGTMEIKANERDALQPKWVKHRMLNVSGVKFKKLQTVWSYEVTGIYNFAWVVPLKKPQCKMTRKVELKYIFDGHKNDNYFFSSIEKAKSFTEKLYTNYVNIDIKNNTNLLLEHLGYI